MLTFLAVLFAAVSIQLGTMAAVGVALGVTLRTFSLGFGPSLVRLDIFRICLIPIGGYVVFRHSDRESVPQEEMRTALDGRSTVEQLAISLSGCFALLAVGYSVAGQSAVDAFARLPSQAFAGAISPLEGAQALVDRASSFVSTASVATLFGVVSAKVAAFNLLPFPTTNGGAALAVMGRQLAADRWWPTVATRALLLVYLSLFASWLIALVAYVGKA